MRVAVCVGVGNLAVLVFRFVEDSCSGRRHLHPMEEDIYTLWRHLHPMEEDTCTLSDLLGLPAALLGITCVRDDRLRLRGGQVSYGRPDPLGGRPVKEWVLNCHCGVQLHR